MTVETFYYIETTSLTSPCTYKICPCNTNICRVRLDFVVSTYYYYYDEPVVLNGTLTLSIMTLCITTLGIMTFSLKIIKTQQSAY